MGLEAELGSPRVLVYFVLALGLTLEAGCDDGAAGALLPAALAARLLLASRQILAVGDGHGGAGLGAGVRRAHLLRLALAARLAAAAADACKQRRQATL